jgi:hypothetical protein
MNVGISCVRSRRESVVLLAALMWATNLSRGTQISSNVDISDSVTISLGTRTGLGKSLNDNHRNRRTHHAKFQHIGLIRQYHIEIYGITWFRGTCALGIGSDMGPSALWAIIADHYRRMECYPTCTVKVNIGINHYAQL